MKIVSAAGSVHIEHFSGEIQAIIQAGSHRAGIRLFDSHAPARDLGMRKALRADHGKGKCADGQTKRLPLSPGKAAYGLSLIHI